MLNLRCAEEDAADVPDGGREGMLYMCCLCAFDEARRFLKGAPNCLISQGDADCRDQATLLVDIVSRGLMRPLNELPRDKRPRELAYVRAFAGPDGPGLLPLVASALHAHPWLASGVVAGLRLGACGLAVLFIGKPRPT